MEKATNRLSEMADWCMWKAGEKVYHKDFALDPRAEWVRHKRGNAEQRGLKPCYTCYETKGGHSGTLK
jgi:hypothetical protein